MTVEYTKDITADIVDRYTDAVTEGADYETRTALVKQIADELDTTEASVRSKLVSEKVYVAKAKASAGEGDSTSKAEYVKALRAVTGLELKSVDKATKQDVKGIFDFIVRTSDEATADEDAQAQRDAS